eukprot:11183203-Lingulodinium_polyedra.AAC.1
MPRVAVLRGHAIPNHTTPRSRVVRCAHYAAVRRANARARARVNARERAPHYATPRRAAPRPRKWRRTALHHAKPYRNARARARVNP